MTIKMPPGRPSFFASIDALRLDARPEHPHIFPTEDESDAADALELIHAHHYSDAEQQDIPVESWGSCTGCADPWPCKTWLWGQQLSLQWLGRAQARYVARSANPPKPVPLDAGTPMPSQRASVDVILQSEHRRLRALRDGPVSSVYCRHPDCRTTVTVPHPLQEGYLHDAVCHVHEHSIADRYPHGWGTT